MKDDCIFCKLANGVFETNKIYEDDEFTVILDAGPANRGHSLIIPKEHYANVYELPEDIAGRAFILAKKIAGHMTDVLKCDGFNIVQNNGEAAGQTVFHFHMHIIPRYENDSVGLSWKPGKLSEEDKKQILDLFED